MKPLIPTASNARFSVTEMKAAAHLYQHAKRYGVKGVEQHLADAMLSALPQVITWLTPDAATNEQAQLFIGNQLIARSNWNYNPAEETLSWHQGSGSNQQSGVFQLFSQNMHGIGQLSTGGHQFSVEINIEPVTYNCNASADAGAYAVASGASVSLKWDVNSAAWKKATWEQNRFTFDYGLEGEVHIGQKEYVKVIGFSDKLTKQDWTPDDPDGFTLLVTPDLRFEFDGSSLIPPDDGEETDIVKSVFPYLMELDFDGFAFNFAGAMLTNEYSTAGNVYAITGQAVSPAITGFYECGNASFGVFDRQLHINGEVIPTSWQQGSVLHWQSLTEEQARLANLPAAGSLAFSANGTSVHHPTTGASGSRVQPAMAAAAMAPGDSLSIYTLTNMSQYEQVPNSNGGYYWRDFVQDQSMEDFYKILQNYMDPALRQQFLSTNPPALDPPVQAISTVAGKNGTKPQDWYQTLSIPYLVNALYQTNDSYAPTLNSIRAQNYLKNQTAISDVFQAQVPLLYAYRWGSSGTNGQMPSFLQDQLTNQQTYAGIIAQDANDWKDKLKKTVLEDGDNIDNLLQMVDDVSAKGQAGLYWAYTFFRFATQPSALNLLRTIALSSASGLDGSAFTRRVQTNCAVLNILDPSSYFVQEYTKVLQLFQLGNILPTLLDYSGDLNDYYYAVKEILDAFVTKYINSSDPQLQEQAASIQKAIKEDLINDVLDSYQLLANSMEGILTWEGLAQRFDKALKSGNWPKLAKAVSLVGSATVRMIVMSAATAGVAGFIIGIKKWDELNATQRAQVVLGGVDVFAQIVAAVVKRGVSWRAAFRAEGFTSVAFKEVASGAALTKAAARVEQGFAYWVVRQDTNGLRSIYSALTPLLEAEVKEELTLTMKFFGRNLDEFVATRLGAVFAVVNIVFSSIALANSKDPEEKAGNALLLASGALELFATGGAWALGALGVEAIGGLAIGTICAAVSGLAALVAIAGVIILLIYTFKTQPSPVENFAKGQANDDGYYMPDKVAIDSFQVYQIDTSKPQFSGVALALNGNASNSLQFNLDGTIVLGAQHNTSSTAFYLQTDYRGYASFGAQLPNGSINTALMLTLDDNQKVTGLGKFTDPAKLGQQQWVAELQGSIGWDGSHPQQAAFAFYNAYWQEQGQKLYLSADSNTGQVSTSNQPTNWLLQMVTVGNAQLVMPSIKLYTNTMDSVAYPQLSTLGSQPLTWSVDPALPAFMALDPTSGQVSQVTGVAPTSMPQQLYTLKLQNPVNTLTAAFSLEVLQTA